MNLKDRNKLEHKYVTFRIIDNIIHFKYNRGGSIYNPISLSHPGTVNGHFQNNIFHFYGESYEAIKEQIEKHLPEICTHIEKQTKIDYFNCKVYLVLTKGEVVREYTPIEKVQWLGIEKIIEIKEK